MDMNDISRRVTLTCTKFGNKIFIYIYISIYISICARYMFNEIIIIVKCRSYPLLLRCCGKFMWGFLVFRAWFQEGVRENVIVLTTHHQDRPLSHAASEASSSLSLSNHNWSLSHFSLLFSQLPLSLGYVCSSLYSSSLCSITCFSYLSIQFL